MAIIKEDYVSFEVAKLLKEKEFNISINSKDWICCMYDENEDIHWGMYDKNWYFRITLQMAMKWLRKEHNILLFLLPAQENGKLVYLVEVWTWNEEEGIYKSTYAPMPRKEPEQAIEAALKYALENLI